MSTEPFLRYISKRNTTQNPMMRFFLRHPVDILDIPDILDILNIIDINVIIDIFDIFHILCICYGYAGP